MIAYHSLEDRCVKQRFREAERGCICPPRIPVCICGRVPRLRVLTRRPLRPERRPRSATTRAPARPACAPPSASRRPHERRPPAPRLEGPRGRLAGAAAHPPARASRASTWWAATSPSGEAPAGPGPARFPALLAGVLLAALALAALRVDLIRVRYGLGQAMQEEKQLLEQERALRAQVGSLRDPIRLARLAPRYGLARPARVLESGDAAPDPHP